MKNFNEIILFLLVKEQIPFLFLQVTFGWNQGFYGLFFLLFLNGAAQVILVINR